MKGLVLALFALLIPTFIGALEPETLEFNDRPIKDVLIVLGELSSKNIIVDETVTGNCSYYFTTSKMEEALDLFLKSNNLYITPFENAFKVSKIYVREDLDSRISISCMETSMESVVKKLSSITQKTILFDTLPTEPLTLNITKLKLPPVLDIIIKQHPEYEIEEAEDYLYIKRVDADVNSITSSSSAIKKGIILNDDGLYSINLTKVRFSGVIEELFSISKLEYSIQGRNDNVIERLNYKNKSFDEILNLILEGGSCDYVVSNNIYYIFDINSTEIANRHIDTEIIKLKNLKVDELLKLMPGSFISNNVIKTDESTNSVIVYGTQIKIAPIIEFIKRTDIDKKQKPRWIKMNFIPSTLFKTLLLKKYPSGCIIDVDKSSFLILLTDNAYLEVMKLKDRVDISPESHLIRLKYIKSEELLAKLPKTIDEDAILSTENPSEIFFYGGNKAYLNFIKILELIDKPIPQIKYKVLVLQNSIGDNSSFSLGMDGHSEDNGDISLPDDQWSAFSGALGNLLSLNFNVLSAFGPLFSFELNASIQENRTKVLVDTTLQGLSGKEINFRNTTTSRFYQTTTDADGDTETGATQEVSWGIILDITGWSSGDGMVTVNVASTISDETTVSGESSGIPSTSEKIVNTEIRTREGEPIVIGGLISSKKEVFQDKTPILGDIPLLGRLFTEDREMETKSEFVIYLLPFIEENELEGEEKKMAWAYKELIRL